MTHEIAVFLQRFIGLVAWVVFGVMLGGVWALRSMMERDAIMRGSWIKASYTPRIADMRLRHSSSFPWDHSVRAASVSVIIC